MQTLLAFDVKTSRTFFLVAVPVSKTVSRMEVSIFYEHFHFYAADREDFMINVMRCNDARVWAVFMAMLR